MPKWDRILIIDSPKVTMAHPLINYDVQAAKASVMEACELEPAEKPLIAVLRGIGGGKTRTTVELWTELNKDPKVLALAITFNSQWTVRKGECEEYFPLTDREERFRLSKACYVWMVISRMASVFFNAELLQMQSQLESVIATAIVDPEGLLRSFVTFLTSRIAEQDITHFVLLVDETAALSRTVETYYGLEDATSILRSGLLSGPIYKPNNTEEKKEVLHVGLVISSLELGPIGQTRSSSRAVQGLKLPLELSATEIVRSWWVPNSSVLPEIAVNLAAALFASMPRVVQIAAGLLPKATNFEDFLAQVCYVMDGRYIVNFPKTHLLRAVVLREKVTLNADVMSLIQKSIFVNSLTAFQEDSVIVPEANLVMLIAAAKNAGSSSGVQHLLSNMLQRIGDQATEARDVLGLLLVRWMNFRFLFLVELEKEITLGTLLQWDSPLPFLQKVPPVNSRCFTPNFGEPARLLNSTYSSPSKLAAELIELFQQKGPIQLYLAAQGDVFDVLLVFGKWLLFFDAKSCDEKENDQNALSNNNNNKRTWKAPKEAQRLTEFYDAHHELLESKFSGWFFIHLATHDDDVEPENGNVITMGCAEARAFFGPLWPCYRVYRSEWSKQSTC